MQYICHTRCCDSNDRRSYIEGRTYDLDPARIERLTENGLLPRYFTPYGPGAEPAKELTPEQLEKLDGFNRGELISLALDCGHDKGVVVGSDKPALLALIRKES